MKLPSTFVLLSLFISASIASGQSASTTTCVPQPRSAEPGKIICTTAPGAETVGGSSIISGIVKARLGYLRGEAQRQPTQGPTLRQLLDMMAIFKPLRDAAADSLGLNGADRETYYSETADALKALFKVYPDAGLAVIHVVLDPITDKYGSRVNAAVVPSRDRPMPSVQPTISTRSARARDALTMGADAYKLGSALKNRAQLQHAVDLLVESDELEPSDDAKFLVAGSAYLIGEIAARQAQSTGSCDLSRLASESFTKARTYLQFGVAGHPEATRQLMEGISQFAPTLSEQKKRFCR